MQNTPADDPSLSIIGETPDLHLLQKSWAYQGAQDDDGGCKEDAHVFCTLFFTWHNTVHRHSGIGYHTPEGVHHGLAAGIREQRAAVLEAAIRPGTLHSR